MIRILAARLALGGLALGGLALSTLACSGAAFANPAYDALIAKHAAANGVPESLVRRVIVRESRYNAGIVSRGNYGLMQIKPATARSMGYSGSPSGLLDPDTNMTYAVKYLAGAYKVAGGNHDRAVSYYARGYYYAAKRQRGPGTMATANADPVNMATGSSAPIVLRPDSLAAFATTEQPRKSRRQRKQDKTPSLIDLFTPKPVPN